LIPITLEEASRVLDGGLSAAADGDRLRPLPEVSIDTRSLEPGQCFFAIKGPHFDGHRFVPEALSKGAGVIVHSEPLAHPDRDDVAYLQVADTTAALQILGHYTRRKWNGTLLGITGSAGKTTTRHFVAAILGERFRVFESPGNLNNEYGVPLSLLRLRPEDEMAVLELGMNHAGEIRRLSRICAPDAALFTNVAPVHLEFFPDLQGIADAKAELLEHLAPAGSVFYNADDPLLCEASNRHPGRKISFGFSEGATVRITGFRIHSLQGMSFEVSANASLLSCTVPFAGRHYLYNLTAAIAAGLAFGLPAPEVQRAVANLKPLAMRGRILELSDKQGSTITLWDDSYNSNPYALESVLHTLSRLEGFERRILALGDMLELGKQAPQLHVEAGKQAAAAHPDLLILVGAHAGSLRQGAESAGMPPERVHCFEDSQAAAGFLAGEVRGGDLLLVKGSRGVRMDRVVERVEEYYKT
jgi:UDP-N-acetylmuramoyl-tripeptide--D-alanyl-D-alanine ligase